jgi:hypothetical protein
MAKLQPAFFPKILYKAKARIEILIGKLTRFKRIALRCEKTARNYSSFIALACAFFWIKSVHTAYGNKLVKLPHRQRTAFFSILFAMAIVGFAVFAAMHTDGRKRDAALWVRHRSG